MPTFSTVPGPPQSGFSGLGRTEISGFFSKCDRIAAISTALPAAIARTVAAGSAPVGGTGRPSRTSRCRHFARQPCAPVTILADGVMTANSSGSVFCTAAPFALRAPDTRYVAWRKRSSPPQPNQRRGGGAAPPPPPPPPPALRAVQGGGRGG